MTAKPSELFWRAIEWYQIAKFRGQIHFWIIWAIAIYLPFEELVLKLIPAPGQTHLVNKNISISIKPQIIASSPTY